MKLAGVTISTTMMLVAFAVGLWWLTRKRDSVAVSVGELGVVTLDKPATFTTTQATQYRNQANISPQVTTVFGSARTV